jgi:hypothetical protein
MFLELLVWFSTFRDFIDTVQYRLENRVHVMASAQFYYKWNNYKPTGPRELAIKFYSLTDDGWPMKYLHFEDGNWPEYAKVGDLHVTIDPKDFEIYITKNEPTHDGMDTLYLKDADGSTVHYNGMVPKQVMEKISRWAFRGMNMLNRPD